MKNLGKFMTIILTMIISPIINGFVFSKLWLWFIVPIFQIQPLRVVEAIGILFIIYFTTVKWTAETNDEDPWTLFLVKILANLVVAAAFLLFGWIVTLFL